MWYNNIKQRSQAQVYWVLTNTEKIGHWKKRPVRIQEQTNYVFILISVFIYFFTSCLLYTVYIYYLNLYLRLY